jgi:plasmid stabilization system protein ParE
VRVVLHPEARREFRRAALWYEERSPGLGDDFVGAVSAILDRIGQRPRSFPPWPEALTAGHEPIRRAVVRRFPYVLAFEVHPDHILVLAVAHAKRRPSYWSGRLAE